MSHAIKKYKHKYHKYKRLYYHSINKPQHGGNICDQIKNTTHILVHGACLDGAMTAYLLIKYCEVDPMKISFIAPGKNILDEISSIHENYQNPRIGLYDLALPEIKLDLKQLGITNLVDHHITTSKIKSNVITYNPSYATSGIVWQSLFKDLSEAPYLLQVINQGDQGKLSLFDPKTILDFISYIGLQTILDTFASRKKNNFETVPQLMNFLILHYDNNIFLQHLGTYEILRCLYKINQYSYTCYTSYIGGKNYTCIYIPKTQFTTTISQIAGKSLEGVDFMIVYPDYMTSGVEAPRLTIRGISEQSDANMLAKEINPSDGGGHIKAASVGVTTEYIDEIKRKVAKAKTECKDKLGTNYLPEFTNDMADLLVTYLYQMSGSFLSQKKLIGNSPSVDPDKAIEYNIDQIIDLQLPINQFSVDPADNKLINYKSTLEHILEDADNTPILPVKVSQMNVTAAEFKPQPKLNPTANVFNPGRVLTPVPVNVYKDTSK